jgi:hypothetical protein
LPRESWLLLALCGGCGLNWAARVPGLDGSGHCCCCCRLSGAEGAGGGSGQPGVCCARGRWMRPGERMQWACVEIWRRGWARRAWWRARRVSFWSAAAWGAWLLLEDVRAVSRAGRRKAKRRESGGRRFGLAGASGRRWLAAGGPGGSQRAGRGSICYSSRRTATKNNSKKRP